MTYKPPKLNEITFERFEQLMEENHAELLEKGSKIASKVIREIYDKKGNFGVANAMNMVRIAITSQLAYENAKTQSGLLIGGRDKFGSKMMAQFAMLMPGGKTLALNSWDPSTNDLMGNKIRIPTLAAVTAKITWEPGKDGYVGKWVILALNEVKPLSQDVVLQTLEKLGIREIADLPQIPHPTGTYPIVCYRTTIQKIRALKPYGEDTERPVWVENSSGKGGSPVLSIATLMENGVQSWIYCEPRNNVPLLTIVEDLEELCKEALEISENPTEQAAFLDGLLGGKKIVVVGSLSSIKPADGKYADYSANVSAMAIIEIPQDLGIKVTPITEPQTTFKGMDEDGGATGSEGTIGESESFKPNLPEDKKPFTETDDETSTRVKKEFAEINAAEQRAVNAGIVSKEEVVKKKRGRGPGKKKEQPVATDQPEVVTEILEMLMEKADILGFETLAGINIDQMAKSRDFKKYNPEIVKQVWTDHNGDSVEEWNKK